MRKHVKIVFCLFERNRDAGISPTDKCIVKENKNNRYHRRQRIGGA